jgi:hypothetical protein
VRDTNAQLKGASAEVTGRDLSDPRQLPCDSSRHLTYPNGEHSYSREEVGRAREKEGNEERFDGID